MWPFAEQGIAENAMRSGSDLLGWWELHGLTLIGVIAAAVLVATLFVLRRRRKTQSAERTKSVMR